MRSEMACPWPASGAFSGYADRHRRWLATPLETTMPKRGKYQLSATRGEDEVLRQGFDNLDEANRRSPRRWGGIPIARSG
jgi:hypothetical protein